MVPHPSRGPESPLSELIEAACAHWPAGHPKLLELLFRSERLSSDVLLRAQLGVLEQLLEHATAEVPYYRTRLQRRGPSAGPLSLDEFRATVPILTRAALQDHAAELRAEHVGDAHRPNGRVIATSGSTGRPVATEGSRALGALAAAQQDRFHRWHGRDPRLTTAFITSPEPQKRSTPGAWTLLGPGEAREFSLAAPVSAQLDWLSDLRPAYLVGYSSNVAALARRSLERGERLPGLRDVTVSSEPVSDELRALVERAWGAKLVATYSANEVGGIALQAPSGTDYLVQAEFVFLEVLGPRGEPCAPGQIGRVVVTTFHHLHRPLIRYEIGDYAEPAPVSGGFGLPRLSRVLGRERNMVRRPDGSEIWPFFELGEIVALRVLKQWQIVQTSERRIEVRVVVERPLDDGEAGTVERVVRHAVGDGLEVELRRVAEIPRGPGGKYEEFVNATGGRYRDPLRA